MKTHPFLGFHQFPQSAKAPMFLWQITFLYITKFSNENKGMKKETSYYIEESDKLDKRMHQEKLNIRRDWKNRRITVQC